MNGELMGVDQEGVSRLSSKNPVAHSSAAQQDLLSKLGQWGHADE